MHYDVTLKVLLPEAHQLLQLLIGSQPKEMLAVEYPSVRDRRPDLVARLEDGRICHVEMQASNDPDMPFRMLNYFSDILYTYRQDPQQLVIFVGRSKLRMTDSFTFSKLKYSYDVVDIRTIDCRPLLASPAIADNILAILCRIEGEEVIRQILHRIAQEEGNARQDYLEHLSILSGLRSLEVQESINRESERMSITVDMGQTIWGKELFNQGTLKGKQEGILEGESLLLQRLLTKRFGPLPDGTLERLNQATSEQLEQWSLRVLEASSLEDVFAQSM